MKINSTIALTVTLLLMMSAAGGASAFWGYALGREALKGVTQPDISPSKNLAKQNDSTAGDKELKILLTEEELLKQAEDIINGKAVPEPVAAANPEETQEDASATEVSNEPPPNLEEILPIQGEDRGVSLEIVDADREGSSLSLTVNLANEGEEEVRFLYSFLDVRDDKGRALSAITEGLPGELPPNGENFSGTIKIPTALLEDAEQLSLTLTDYPDRELELNLAGIPVLR